MKLLVDIGNSRVKWAFGVEDRFVASGELPRGIDPELGVMLEAGLSPQEIRIANVAGAEAGARIAGILEGRFRIKPVFAQSAASGAGVRTGYSDPGQLGIDRWLALCAAFSRYQAAVCVVDAGTATTLDLVSASGEHQGGMILPGLELMQTVLLRETGDLARLAVGADTSRDGMFPHPGSSRRSGGRRIELGRETATAIRCGGLQATACLARECMDELRASQAAGADSGVLVLTGGAAPALEAALHRLGGVRGNDLREEGYRLEHRRQLVLEGLALDPPCFTTAG